MKVNNTSHIIKSYSNPSKIDKDEKNLSLKIENQLSDKEKREVEKLKKEDQRVRIHENAHKAAAGSLAKGAPSFKYKMGPDGKRYAIAGSVKVDTSEISNNPEATIRKAQQIKTAALAPAEPSSQDLKVATEAAKMEAKARRELLKENSTINEDKKDINLDKVMDLYYPTKYHSNIEFTF